MESELVKIVRAYRMDSKQRGDFVYLEVDEGVLIKLYGRKITMTASGQLPFRKGQEVFIEPGKRDSPVVRIFSKDRKKVYYKD